MRQNSCYHVGFSLKNGILYQRLRAVEYFSDVSKRLVGMLLKKVFFYFKVERHFRENR